MKKSKGLILTLAIGLFLIGLQQANAQSASKDQLAQTPPMGWNSWNHFGCNVNEQLIMDIADAMVSSGMKEAGYEYVVIDDCWMSDQRDEEGNLQPDPNHFPHGMKHVADYVHKKGLKLGIYSSAGTKTCQGLPASLDHEQADAASFAKWGIDYLKYDNCYNQHRPAVKRYTAMRNALDSAGRPIVYSICEWGSNDPWEWAPEIGNLWRTTGDIHDSWRSMMVILDQQVGLGEFAGKGHWNDPDMLEVGNGGMTETEYRAHFSLWSILSSPLMAGNDLRKMSQETIDILTNKEVIAVNQDPGGNQGYKLEDNGDQEIWVKELADGSEAVVLLNRGDDPAFMTAKIGNMDLVAAEEYTVRNLWRHEEETKKDGLVRSYVQDHGVQMYRITPTH